MLPGRVKDLDALVVHFRDVESALFTTADGVERLWEISEPLLNDPPPVRSYGVGTWGPNAIHQLIAPRAWRLPFERGWRDPNDYSA